MPELRIVHFVARDGDDLFEDWLDSIRDRNAKAAIESRIRRLAASNLGDHRYLRDGVYELRIDVGPGYRVYFSRIEDDLLILLCGGARRTQDDEISRAIGYLQIWKNANPRYKRKN